VGTPTVVAPGAIFLVGEFGLPEEEVAVLAALSSYATAQYFPDVSPVSPLVAAVVERAKTHLGEAAAALPAGSVLLSPAKAPTDGQGLTFDTAPAIAVATAAAIFETAGQSISERRDEILVVAEAGLRAVHEGIAADGELAAALNGGLIRSSPWPPPPLAWKPWHRWRGCTWSSFRRDMPCFPRAGCRACANSPNATAWPTRRSPMNCSIRPAVSRPDCLRRRHRRHRRAGRYGHCITQLAAAASAPLQSGSFMRAVDLAKEIGGVAKTTSAWRTGMGVAMFATPELRTFLPTPAARSGLARRRAGPFRRSLPGPRGSHTPAPETGPSSISAEAIVRNSVEERTTEKTLSAAEPISRRDRRRRGPGPSPSIRGRGRGSRSSRCSPAVPQAQAARPGHRGCAGHRGASSGLADQVPWPSRRPAAKTQDMRRR